MPSPSDQRSRRAVGIAVFLLGLAGVTTVALVVPAAADTAEASAVDTPTRNHTTNATNLTVLTGPRLLGEALPNRSAIRAASRSGRLVRDRGVVATDTLVLRLRAPNVTRAFAAANGTATERFLAASTGPRSTFRLEQTNPTAERPRKIARLDDAAVTGVVADPTNHTYHVIVDLDRASVTYGTEDEYGAEPTRFDGGDAFQLNLTVAGRTTLFDTVVENGYVDDVPVVTVLDRKAVFGAGGDLDRVALPPAANATVLARTTLAPGTPVSVRIANRSDGGPPLVGRTRVTDTDDPIDGDHRPPGHAVRTTVNASGLAPNATFDLRLLAGGTRIGGVAGAVRKKSASVAIPESEDWRDGTVRVTRANLSDGGFLVAQAGDRRRLAGPDWITYRGSLAVESGPYRNLTIPIRAGDITRLSVPLPSSVTVVAVRDVNDNGRYDDADRPYFADAAMAADVARIPDPESAPDAEYPPPADLTPARPGSGRTGTPGGDVTASPSPSTDRGGAAGGTPPGTTPGGPTESGGQATDAVAPGTTTATGPGFRIGIALAACLGVALARWAIAAGDNRDRSDRSNH